PSDPGAIRVEAIREACDLFARAQHIEVHRPGEPAAAKAPRLPLFRDAAGAPHVGEGAIYVVPDLARMSLDLAKNLVVHFFVSRAMVATALLAREDIAAPAEIEPLRERVRALSRLFKYEFQFRADATFEQIFDETLDAMILDGELVRRGATVSIAGDEERAQVVLYAQIVRN